MTLYTKNGEYPIRLPSSIRLSDGTMRTDQSSFSEQEIADAGYIKIENPPTVEYPNKLEWDGVNLQWIVRPPNDRELMARWDELRRECYRLLAETDYKIIKAMETGLPVDPSYVTYRQELRDLYNNVNAIDPWNVVFPNLINAYANTYANTSSDGL